jgi:hypothetical protein
MVKIQEIAEDLRSLGVLFEKNWSKNIDNPGVLQTLIYNYKSSKCNYELGKSQPLIFKNIQVGRNCLPKDLAKHSKKLIIKLHILFSCRETQDEYADPIDALGVNISIESLGEDDFLQSWHLDRVGKEAEVEQFTHPIYHLNFGGNAMRKSGKDFGSLMLLSSPRICHPPLDIVLAIDFILRNFYEKETHSIITQDRGYKRCIRNAANRFWRPFAISYASFWIQDYSNLGAPLPSEIFPSLDCSD